MLKLYFVKAGDEMNNMDAFVWATDPQDALREWLASEFGDIECVDRIWEVPTLPPSKSAMVEWPEPVLAV